MVSGWGRGLRRADNAAHCLRNRAATLSITMRGPPVTVSTVSSRNES